jgi:amino-acid N-acetyltransferase
MSRTTAGEPLSPGRQDTGEPADALAAPASEIRFERTTTSDLDAIRDLLVGCGLPTEDLRPDLEHFLLGRMGEHLVGSVGLEPLGDIALLRSLAVAKDLRGRKIGWQLWARARDMAITGGITRLYLLTTTAETLFAKWGFRRIDREDAPPALRGTTEFTSLCPAAAAVMTVELA